MIKKIQREQFKSKFQKGDFVKVISGNYKGKIGKITIFNKKSFSAVIDCIQYRKKLLKKNEQKEFKIINIFIHISNLMLFDSIANLSSKCGILYKEGQKRRFYKKSGNLLELVKKR